MGNASAKPNKTSQYKLVGYLLCIQQQLWTRHEAGEMYGDVVKLKIQVTGACYTVVAGIFSYSSKKKLNREFFYTKSTYRRVIPLRWQ